MPIRCWMPRSAVAEELLSRHADVLGDLTEERWSNVAAFMGRDRGAAAAFIAELLVGAALTHKFKTQFPQDVCHLRGLENWS